MFNAWKLRYCFFFVFYFYCFRNKRRKICTMWPSVKPQSQATLIESNKCVCAADLVINVVILIARQGRRGLRFSALVTITSGVIVDDSITTVIVGNRIRYLFRLVRPFVKRAAIAPHSSCHCHLLAWQCMCARLYFGRTTF